MKSFSVNFLALWLVALCFGPFCLAIVPLSTRNALVELYNTLGGDEWLVRDNWLLDDPCENHWFGVQCNANRTAVYDITLKGNQLHGLFPSASVWEGLPDIVVLDMSDNELSGEISCSITYCGRLQTLLLGGNMLTGQLPFCLTSIAQTLGIIDVANNKLSGGFPVFLLHFKIIKLSLYGNAFSGRVPDEIATWSNIARLDLGSNAFSGSVPCAITSMNSLHELGLNNNKFSGLLPEMPLGLTSVRLEGNNFMCPLPSSNLCESASCSYCSSGNEVVSRTKCKQCEGGEWSDGRKCEKCPAGEYSATPGASSCLKCPSGTFAMGKGASACHSSVSVAALVVSIIIFFMLVGYIVFQCCSSNRRKEKIYRKMEEAEQGREMEDM